MTHFTMYQLLEKKKHGLELSPDEIQWMINGLLDKSVAEYQMTAMLMAIYLNGMSKKETAELTKAMLNSGRKLNFDDPTVVDKHSTGGIGDKTSFILAPIAAACGVKVPMIAGRGLGHTGGTVDKVEAIPGFKTNLSMDEFETRLMKDSLVLMGQTPEIAPADRIIYALRDVTATIDSIPLITASIMSKKLAEGANGIVMDIKVGSGAFMSTKSDAKKLAKSILYTAKDYDKKCVPLLTNMNQPLGKAVGHTLELIECFEVLKDNGPKDLTDLSIELAAHMIRLAGKAKTQSAAVKQAKQAVKSGAALKVFEKLIKDQGGDPGVLHNYDLMDLAQTRTEVLAPKDGYLKSFANKEIGFLCTELGGGRKVKTDQIDFGVGFYFHKKIGDKIKKGESLLTIYHRDNQLDTVTTVSEALTEDVIKIGRTKPAKQEIIYDLLEN